MSGPTPWPNAQADWLAGFTYGRAFTYSDGPGASIDMLENLPWRDGYLAGQEAPRPTPLPTTTPEDSP